MSAAALRAELIDRYSDARWRLNNLYWIVDRHGRAVRFQMNDAQAALYEDMWYLNVVLKARQLGFTTLIDLFLLDRCLFNADVRAGIVAHNLDDAKTIFRDKIKYPYDRLEDGLRQACEARTDRHGELLFANNSSIRVATSMRSGTLQLLHVSEYGKIARQYPQRAAEIKTGAFEAVGAGEQIFVESTAEGRAGEFYELTQRARQLAQAASPLTRLDWKFFFFPWHRFGEYALAEAEAMAVAIPARLGEYFERLKAEHGIALTRGQQAWYVKKEATLGELVKREHPSTPDEAFEASIEGAYFARQMAAARSEGRIAAVPHTEGAAVDTWWDLGMNDDTAIWFTQTIGRECHVIDYYEACGEGFAHYAGLLSQRAAERGYRYHRHTGPHDLVNRELGPGTSRIESARAHGIRFEIAPRPLRKIDDIEAARNFLGVCWFDAERCATGIEHLDAYRKDWDEIRGVWRDAPRHDAASHAADAFQVLATMHGRAVRREALRGRRAASAPPPKGAWT